jgi:prepilin-type N-terminal cleavage/methylation domain-containing protein
MTSSSKNNQAGYTIAEMLVALALLTLLLFFSSGILGNLALNNKNSLKLKAIQAAKNQLEKTVLFKNYRDFEEDISVKLFLKQQITKQGGLVKIIVTVYQKKTNQILYRLTAYEKK